MYNGTQKQEIAQAGGVRRVEFRYSGDIDASGNFKLKRCVGKSFFIKSGQTGSVQDNSVITMHRFPGIFPEKIA